MSDVPPLPTFGGENDGSDDGSESARWVKHNVRNHTLDLLTLQGSSPGIEQCLQVEELCRTALTYLFALDVFLVHVHGVVAMRAVLLERKIFGTMWVPACPLHDEEIHAVEWSGFGNVAPLGCFPASVFFVVRSYLVS